LIVVLVAGTAIGLAALNRRSSPPEPVHPGPVETIIRTGTLNSYAGLADGSTLTIWEHCRANKTHCRSAWLLRHGSSMHSGLIKGRDPAAYAAGDRFVVSSWARLGFVVSTDGSTRPLSRGSFDFTPDAFVQGRSGVLAVDTGTGRAAPLPHPSNVDGVAEATLAGDGSVLALPLLAGPGKVSLARLDNDHWSTTPVPSGDLPGILAVSGGHAAALISSDGATVLPVETLAVSTDDGKHWTMLGKADVPFKEVDSMAAVGDVLFVATPTGLLYRSTGSDWTHFTRVDTPTVTGLVPAGTRVLGQLTDIGGTSGFQQTPTDQLVSYDSQGKHQLLPDQRSTSAPQPTDTASPETRAAQIVRAGKLVGAAGHGQSLLTTWSVCRDRDHQDCDFAWQLRTPTGVWNGRAYGSDPIPEVAGNDYVVSSWDHLGFLVDTEGRTRPLERQRHEAATVNALIDGGAKVLAVEARSATTGFLPAPTGHLRIALGTVTANGTTVASLETAGPTPAHVSVATLDQSDWKKTVLSEGNVTSALVSGGEHVAALASYDGIDSWAVGTLAVSPDSGRHWTQLHKADVPFDDLDALAATSTGVLFVSTVHGQVFRSTNDAWTSFVAMPQFRNCFVIGAIGDRILVQAPDKTYHAVDGTGHATGVELR
jgi:hypothetical protein